MTDTHDTDSVPENEAHEPTHHGGFRQLMRDVVTSIRGSDEDFTSGPLGRAILLLSIPMVLEMLMEGIFAVVDVFFVARLGAGAVATVGITESMITIVYAIAFGLSMGTTAVIARRIGEKRPEAAAVSAVQAIAVGTFVSLPVSVLGIFGAKWLLGLMGAAPEVIEEGHTYTAILIGGNLVINLIFIINAIFRGAGDAAIAMRVLWLANSINIVLDPCLIFGWGPFPELGIKGAAVATTIGRGVGVVAQLWALSRGHRIRITREQVRLEFGIMWRLVRVSLGGIGQFVIATASWVGLVRIVAIFGSEVLAGYTVAIRIIIFTLLPSWGMGNAAATLVGQSLGAGKPDRAERSVWLSGFANVAFLGIIAVIFITNSEFLVRIFTQETAVVEVGAKCLRILSYGYLLYAMGMVVVQAFNGAGDTITPTWINLFCFWVLELPLAYTLALPMGFNENGVFVSIVVAESMMTIIGIIIFRRGRWKTRIV